MTNSLVGILCRFREESVAVTCDIEGMFLQVGVKEEDRDFLRFLWWQDGDYTAAPTEYRMTVHLFGATSSPACANYALKATATKYKETYGKEAADFVKDDFYVDDGLKSVRTAEDAFALIDSSRKLCKEGGFNLHKFACNEKSVIVQIPEDIRAKDVQDIDLKFEPLPIERTLGIEWCLESDTFRFRISLTDKPATRRGILSSVSSIYDPLGLVAPFLLGGRKILQEICRDGNGWDDPISENLLLRWDRWRNDLLCLSKLTIPRCYKPVDFGLVSTVQLHHFCDASMEGYGECSYIRLIDDKGHVTTSLVMAKSRVTPTKALTIPRLELTAALTAVKVSGILNKELSYTDVENYYWSDSKVVLGYIANEAKRFHIFVANRVQQLRDRSQVKEWHHVGTKENPADLASRGATTRELVESQLWWKGPAYLSSVNILPLKTEVEPVPDEDQEVKKSMVHSSTVKKPEFADLPERLEYFSDWHRARKAVALCRRYLARLKDRKVDPTKPLTVEEINDTEKIILREIQRKDLSAAYTPLKQMAAYPKDKGDARQRRDTMKGVTNLYRLDPYISSDNLLRVGGRIRRANIPKELAHPIILPDGHVPRLIVEFFHRKSAHSGKTTTLNEVRAAGYWILRGRSLVSSIIHKCVTCRKLRFPTEIQKMADLPVDRLEPAAPFTYTGVDYFGPFYIKEGRSERKRWGCLFTCLVTRAVHIEVANSLTTDSFIFAYRRLVGRRGPVRTLRSDRGTNFVGAKAELAAALAEMDQQKIKRELLLDSCDWIEFKMNVPPCEPYGRRMGEND